MYTSKILRDLSFRIQKTETKITFAKVVLVVKMYCQNIKCFSSKNLLTEHKEVCSSINGAQFVKLEKRTIKFKNTFKQMQVPFKIYSDFEFVLKSAKTCLC